eukprot:PhF_6_TR40728/c0_g1_i1/m.61270
MSTANVSTPSYSLGHSWTVDVYPTTTTTGATTNPTTTSHSYSFSTVEQFWHIWNSVPVRPYPKGCEFVFRWSILKPLRRVMEGEGGTTSGLYVPEKCAGKYIVRNIAKADRERCWLEVVLTVIGEAAFRNLGIYEVCGVRLQSDVVEILVFEAEKHADDDGVMLLKEICGENAPAVYVRKHPLEEELQYETPNNHHEKEECLGLSTNDVSADGSVTTTISPAAVGKDKSPSPKRDRKKGKELQQEPVLDEPAVSMAIETKPVVAPTEMIEPIVMLRTLTNAEQANNKKALKKIYDMALSGADNIMTEEGSARRKLMIDGKKLHSYARAEAVESAAAVVPQHSHRGGGGGRGKDSHSHNTSSNNNATANRSGVSSGSGGTLKVRNYALPYGIIFVVVVALLASLAFWVHAANVF